MNSPTNLPPNPTFLSEAEGIRADVGALGTHFSERGWDSQSEMADDLLYELVERGYLAPRDLAAFRRDLRI
jgi:hypothetical protein